MALRIERLTPAHTTQVMAMRRRSLEEHPEAFGASPAEEAHLTEDDWSERLDQDPAQAAYYGALTEDDVLVGMVIFHRHTRVKMKHRGHIASMYVAPEARGQGAGRAMLDAVIQHARDLGDVDHLVLGVITSNTVARRMYGSAGFEGFGVDPRMIRVGDVYHDIEWMVLYL